MSPLSALTVEAGWQQLKSRRNESEEAAKTNTPPKKNEDITVFWPSVSHQTASYFLSVNAIVLADAALTSIQ